MTEYTFSTTGDPTYTVYRDITFKAVRLGRDLTDTIHVRQATTAARGNIPPWEGLAIIGVRANGTEINSQFINFHPDNLDALIGALQRIRLGPLGRLALDAEGKLREDQTNA